MAEMFITSVRHSKGKGDELLAEFVHKTGMYAPVRPPRGVDPAQAGVFLADRLKPEDPFGYFKQAWLLSTFYERTEAVPVCMDALGTSSGEYGDLMRSTFAARIVGDMGEPAQSKHAGDRLAEMLTRPESEHLYAEFGKAYEVLSPNMSTDKASAHFARLLPRLEKDIDEDEAIAMHWAQANALNADALPLAVEVGAYKQALLDKPPEVRAGDLVKTYLETGDRTSDHLTVWAGRLLRKDAAEQPDPIRAALDAELEAILGDDDLDEFEKDVYGVRAVQAIIYLQQAPTQAQIEWYGQALTREGIHINFLWDDPES
ncbi:MAG: hypothetical protein K8E66_10340 [Phycisphaerales bacterium]|nr:hypothetical protein [Phycisphaerales bacterium]